VFVGVIVLVGVFEGVTVFVGVFEGVVVGVAVWVGVIEHGFEPPSTNSPVPSTCIH
jgi:hypothetical protein